MELKHARALAAEAGLRLPPPIGEGICRGFGHFGGYGGLDLGRLGSLLEESFGRRLVPGFFQSEPRHVIISGDYEAVAIIREAYGADYLDKFAVRPSSQGRGLAKSLWSEMSGQHGSLIWRSRTDNPASRWYSRNSDSSAEIGKWTVFWYGLDQGTARGIAPAVAMIPETLMR